MNKIIKEIINIEVYKTTLDNGVKVSFSIDNSSNTLSINYDEIYFATFCWYKPSFGVPTLKEFLGLERVSTDYIARKLINSVEKVFDLEYCKKLTCENFEYLIKDDEAFINSNLYQGNHKKNRLKFKERYDEMISQINHIETNNDGVFFNEAYSAVKDFKNDLGLIMHDYDCDYVYCEKKAPYWFIEVMKVFDKDIKPLLKEEEE